MAVWLTAHSGGQRYHETITDQLFVVEGKRLRPVLTYVRVDEEGLQTNRRPRQITRRVEVELHAAATLTNGVRNLVGKRSGSDGKHSVTDVWDGERYVGR